MSLKTLSEPEQALLICVAGSLHGMGIMAKNAGCEQLAKTAARVLGVKFQPEGPALDTSNRFAVRCKDGEVFLDERSVLKCTTDAPGHQGRALVLPQSDAINLAAWILMVADNGECLRTICEASAERMKL